MITQIQISVRMSIRVKDELDKFCYAAAAPRNMVINRAAKENVYTFLPGNVYTIC